MLDFTYSFNLGTANNGNVASIANNRAPGRSQSFTYDELNRIATAQSAATSGGDCWGLQFGYDIWANLLSASVTKCSAPTLALTINTLNRIADSGFVYDAAGNLKNEPQKTYTYDAENRMTQSVVSGVTTTYAYDGDGKRVKKSSGKLYWYGLGSDPAEESNLSGVASADFIFFGGKRTARLDLPGAVVHYYFANHLGSANVVTSSTGTIQDDSDFYPFGGERVVTDTDPNAYKFTGKERDTESNLDEFGARYYSSQLGRFTIPDWADAPTAVPYASFGDPQSLNLYSYVGNNPVTRFDVDGHCWPMSECVTKFQNAVSAATDKVINAAANSGNVALAVTVNTAAGMTRDMVNAAADPFNAGAAVGACMDSCNGVQMTDAVSQDLSRTSGLVSYAASAVAVGEAVASRIEAPPPSPEPAPAQGTSNAAPQKSSATLRKEWAAKEGKPWPKDPETGGNQQVHHKQAKADGGPANKVSNIEPLPRREHQQLHKDRGDFKRWGARAKKPEKP